MTAVRSDLPACALIPDLLSAVSSRNVIVGAPPGAGKSTVLPLALLGAVSGRIIMLQPRRVVVRNLAGYLAAQLGEDVGQTVGYRIRGENKTSATTRLEVVTEGVLSRLIQNDPELEGVSVIIFDEFHERSVHSDFGLALALEVQEGLRDDLSLVVMSATLDVEELLRLLPDAMLLKSSGRQFDVEEIYLGQVPPPKLHEQVVRTIKASLDNDEGDILVFLPGAGAINRVAANVSAHIRSSECVIHSLYGALNKSQQMAALQSDPQGKRKVILATNIAETSLTIEGIRVVIDSGLENVATFHAISGFTQLNTQLISQASATQRKGRAGRLGPGKVYRLWGREQHERLASFPVPQILREDICALVLDALTWGTQLADMALLTRPTNSQLKAVHHRLATLQAVDECGNLTAYGRKLGDFPAHPAVANTLLQSVDVATTLELVDLPETACWVAALSEEAISSFRGMHLSDWLRQADAQTVARISRQARRFAALLGIALNLSLVGLSATSLAVCLALTFPERIAKRRQGDDFKLASGRGARLPDNVIEKSDWLAVLDGQVLGSDVTVRVAEPIDEKLLRKLFPDAFAARNRVEYNSQKKVMEARRIEGFHNITLTSEPASDISTATRGRAWVRLLETLPLSQWPLTDHQFQWWYRYQLACKYSLTQMHAFEDPPLWRSVSTPLELVNAETLITRLGGLREWDQLIAVDWAGLSHQALPWSQQHALDSLLPTHITVPGGENRKLLYRADGEVILAVRLQEMFGCASQITVAEGKKVVTIELLSPAGRPIQTTSDLAGFWQGSYFAVQKEMKGRYPKHRWPDDPMSEQAGKSIKPRRS